MVSALTHSVSFGPGVFLECFSCVLGMWGTCLQSHPPLGSLGSKILSLLGLGHSEGYVPYPGLEALTLDVASTVSEGQQVPVGSGTGSLGH